MLAKLQVFAKDSFLSSSTSNLAHNQRDFSFYHFGCACIEFENKHQAYLQLFLERYCYLTGSPLIGWILILPSQGKISGGLMLGKEAQKNLFMLILRHVHDLLS